MSGGSGKEPTGVFMVVIDFVVRSEASGEASSVPFSGLTPTSQAP
jgi:hypothetical protein